MKALFEFIKNALSNKGEPSSTRMNVFILVSQWSVAITIGFFVVLRYVPTLIMEYLGAILFALLAAMGIKTTEAVKTFNKSPEKKDETGS